MGRDVVTIVITPAALRDAPAYIGERLAGMMSEHDGAFGIVLIASQEDARRFSELHDLWMFGPPVAVDETT